jgi:sigma-B regulation protein RsbU (phosphoserine phosphatase)
MAVEAHSEIRTSLVEKRACLEDWLETCPAVERQETLGLLDEQAVHAHLQVVEQSLEKVESGEFGICKICQGHIEEELLYMDYTAEVCLGDLSEEQVRGLELELQLAQTVQKSLLPQQAPETPHLEVAAFSRPAQMIGGDYFDFFEFGNGLQGLVIADVAGHGISAALHMASVQALLRTLVPANTSPAAVVEHVQRLLIHNVRFANFVTLFLASFDPVSWELTYCNAGHNPPILVRQAASGEKLLHRLAPTGAAVGLVEGLALGEATIRLDPGDMLLLYTDGITEAMDAAGEPFGDERLMQVVGQRPDSSPKELIQDIRQALLHFTGQQPLADDTTLVACKILG